MARLLTLTARDNAAREAEALAEPAAAAEVDPVWEVAGLGVLVARAAAAGAAAGGADGEPAAAAAFTLSSASSTPSGAASRRGSVASASRKVDASPPATALPPLMLWGGTLIGRLPQLAPSKSGVVALPARLVSAVSVRRQGRGWRMGAAFAATC